VLPLERLEAGLIQFEEIAARHGLPACTWGHGGDGNVHANLLLEPDNAAESAAAERAGEKLLADVVALGGSIAGEHGVGAVKSQAMRELYPKANLALQQRIKQQFDPLNLLNPGKKAAL
jgi:FAD/FMN-containing dehydrogenase